MPGIRTSMSTTSGRSAVAGLAGHGDPVGALEYHAEARPDQFLVVDDEHPDRPGLVGAAGGGHSDGSRAATAKPSSGVGPTVRLPPQEATRSAIPARPSPAPFPSWRGRCSRGPRSVMPTVR